MSHSSRDTCTVAKAWWRSPDGDRMMAIGDEGSTSAPAHLERQGKLKGCERAYKLLRTSPILEQKDAHDDKHHAKQLLA